MVRFQFHFELKPYHSFVYALYNIENSRQYTYNVTLW
jgi:hypothetical protein